MEVKYFDINTESEKVLKTFNINDIVYYIDDDNKSLSINKCKVKEVKINTWLSSNGTHNINAYYTLERISDWTEFHGTNKNTFASENDLFDFIKLNIK